MPKRVTPAVEADRDALDQATIALANPAGCLGGPAPESAA